MGRVRSRETAEEGTIRAAAYVRMSTEPQTFSIDNQMALIVAFAEQRGFEIVPTYEDAGRSSLTIDGREAIQQLMADVTSGRADFDAILVYDVSRWGRFQDADEGAYYEHLCRRAGLPVHFCAEQFDNDGSIGSILLKAVKRVMAGEYSRELSVKVFAGQRRLIECGYRQGGMAGFGLRRLLVNEHGAPNGELGPGERKSLQTDRVVLVPGPDKEVEAVRRMYRLFASGIGGREIAEHLNREGLRTDLGRPWTRGTVHQVLTNPKYVGDNVYNRVSNKLKQKRVVNAPELWVVAKAAFPAVVDTDLFAPAWRIAADAMTMPSSSRCCRNCFGRPERCRVSSPTNARRCRPAASTVRNGSSPRPMPRRNGRAASWQKCAGCSMLAADEGGRRTTTLSGPATDIADRPPPTPSCGSISERRIAKECSSRSRNSPSLACFSS